MRLVGRVPHDEVADWIAAATDVLCQPSLVEPFGQALLEALASERSVVATRVGGPPEFVPPEAGVLVDPTSVEAIAEGLAAARASEPEPRGAGGRRRARRRTQAERVERVLEGRRHNERDARPSRPRLTRVRRGRPATARRLARAPPRLHGREVVFGILASSLALLADAGHMLTDAAALALALLAASLAARPAGGRWTFGFGRVEILAAQANGITLVLIGVWIVYEAVRRLIDPPEVDAGVVGSLRSPASP